MATKRFERDCLSEYSEVFKAVCVDAAYYTFPRVEYIQGLDDQVPDNFRFGFKVTDLITIKKFPNHARHGAKAGQANPDFLNADLFATAFLKPCEEIRSKIGVLMFEFSRFWPRDPSLNLVANTRTRSNRSRPTIKPRKLTTRRERPG
ncbi:MAG: DUF72 domain-containing protein [Verrucomicrobia bacterium]|nr:DUF72 domain-containing protein [Verrucomicrobiota bacterium]